MARSITEIYDSIIAEKESMAALSELQPDPDAAQIEQMFRDRIEN